MRVTPVPNTPRSRFQVRLDGQVYGFTVAWNDRLAAWILGIETADGEAIQSGIRMVLDWPLFDGLVDDRLPDGELLVIDPAGMQKAGPGRLAWDEEGEDLRLIYTGGA